MHMHMHMHMHTQVYYYQHMHMFRLKSVLEVSSDGDNMADGASAGHTCAAHLEQLL